MSEPTQSSQSHLVFPLQHRVRQSARAVDKLERSCLPGYEYVIAHLYDKYRRNFAISTVSQTSQTLNSFLLFLQKARSAKIESICRKDIAAYVDHEQERGLKVNSVRNHLKTVYTFLLISVQ